MQPNTDQKLPRKGPNHNANLEKQAQQAIWHSLVVKVICWKDGLVDGGIIKSTDKITPKEWRTYQEGIIKANANTDRQKVLQKLNELKKRIKGFNGFK